MDEEGVLIEPKKKTGKKPTDRYRPYQLVFDPTPKQKWHRQLIALIPPYGHELDVPIEFAQFPYAKYEWLRIMEWNKRNHVITPEHRELLYGYCLMVERRKRCILEWDGNEFGIEGKDEKGEYTARIDYLAYEIDRLTKDIDAVASKMGLYADMKKGKKASKEKTNAESEESDGDEYGRYDGDLFD